MSKWAALAALAWPAAADAQAGGLQSCDEIGVGLTSLAVDERSGVRTFYQGMVTLLALNTEEPVGAPAGFAVIMPDAPIENEPPGTACWAMIGLGGVDVDRAGARYDPASGLTLTIPVYDFDPETGGTIPGEPVRLRIDAGRGTIADIGSR